mgnify:CR=1 FL=1
MSRFDYPDPGQDPTYCDGLAADYPPGESGPYMQWAPVPRNPWGVHRSDGRVIKRFPTAACARAFLVRLEKAVDDTSDARDTCDWCSQPYVDRAEYPYCSTVCAVQAEIDTSESRGDSYV